MAACCSTRVTVPAASAPSAVASDPASVYQANTSVLVRSVTTCESAACSIDRNGPTSLPLGLMTPMVPASTRSQRLPVDAKTSPAASHQHRADDQHAAASDPIGARREGQRDDGVADERQGQQQAGLRLAQSDADQVEHQHDGQRSVREQADESRGEEQPRVTGETLKRGGIAWGACHDDTGWSFMVGLTDVGDSDIFRLGRWTCGATRAFASPARRRPPWCRARSSAYPLRRSSSA